MRKKDLTVLIALLALVFPIIVPLIDADAQENSVSLTWFGFSAFEIATQDYSSVVYTNPNIWLYNQSQAFGVKLKPQYESPEALAEFLKEKKSENIVLTLTNDHPDEIGDLFTLAKVLQDAGLDYKIVAQSDLVRNWMMPELSKRGLDPNSVLRIGYGGTVTVGEVKIIATLALHGSTPWPISMVIDLGGVRIWHTGGTSIFSDMKLIDRLYDPQIALISITGAQFSMGPMEAAYATRLLRPEIAIPTHYLASAGQFPGVSTVKDVEEFEKYVQEFSFGKVKVVTLTLGEPFAYTAENASHEDSVNSNSDRPTAGTKTDDDSVYTAAMGAGTFLAGFTAAKMIRRK
jgi:L-ascorbate metabolism protein UlaG (beta-lactamase superfamily)